MCLAKLSVFATTALLTCIATIEEPSIRSYAYIGGRYVEDDAGNHMYRDQMYVEHLVPIDGITHDWPVILIHGQGQTGTNFLVKPDGGRGWASEFLRQGYEVYIVDQTLRGRSGPHEITTSPKVFSVERIQERFTAPKNYNLWPQASKHSQWPGSGTIGDPVFDAFYRANVQFIDDPVYQQQANQQAGAELLDMIGKPSIIIGHSQGGVLPILLADARPSLAKSLVLLEPLGPPFRNAVFETSYARQWGLTDIPLNYHPRVNKPSDLKQETFAAEVEEQVDCLLQDTGAEPRQLPNLANKPILMVTGEASYHAAYDHCTVSFLQQAGCFKTEHLKLGEHGIHGNGHMFFLEKNSGAIQNIVKDWLVAQE